MKTNSKFKKLTSLLLSLVFVLSSFTLTGFSSLNADIAKADEGEKFLMAYFTGNLQTEQQIKFAVSTDGSNFKPLYGGNAVLQEKSTDTNNYDGYTYTDGVRDPFIFDGHDGYYYCIATDLEATAYGFWGNQSQMVLWRSADLINWSDAYYINVAQIANAKRGTSFANSDFQRTWAPEVFYEEGQYMIYFALAGGDYQATRMHYMITDDLMDWTHYSAPQVLYDPGYDDIDADIIKEGDTYYMFYKDETPGRSTVCLATASAMTGPYSFVAQFDTSSATGGIEGCEVYKVGSNYYLVADRFGAAGNFAIYNLGTSLAGVANAVNDGHISVTSDPISTVEELYGFTNLTPRHGSIMPISNAQYNALVAASGGVTDDDIMYNFTKSYSRTSDGWAYENGYADSSLHNLDFMFKENGSSVKVAHDAGYITMKNATIFCNDETVRGMLPDDVYTVSFDYSLESTTNLSAPIFALGTGSGAPYENTDYVMIFGNGDMWVRKSGENQDTFVGNKPLTLGATYHYDVVSDGTNITFYRDGEKIGQIAATVDFPTSGTRYAAFGFTDGHSTAGYGYGSYSKIRFRNRAVSANEIYAEANEALIYRKDNGSDTIDGLENAMNVSHSGNHNVAEPLISHNAASYTIAGWVNPGESVDYNSVMIGIGSGKWTPGPYGRYLAIREDGTILFNYCSGSNGGGNWSQHYADINNAFSVSANTWAYLQVNIVPISDNQVKVVVFKDGVQTSATDVSLTTKVDDNDTTGNDYAYGMLGMLQLPTNNIYLGRMPVPNWWENENGTTYAKDVRFYAQAKDPSDLYEEITINKEAPEAIEYVRANLESYDVEALSYRNAYHNGHVATGGFNNVIASATGFACNDVWNNNTKYSDVHFAVFYPTDIVLSYDGVNTPALPCQLEMHCYGDNKTLATIYCSDGGYGDSHRNANFRLAHYWTGYTSDYTQWVGDTYAYNHADYPINDNGKAEVEADGNSHIGYYAGWQWDYNFAVPRGEGTGSFFWNKLNYTGTLDSSTYKETYTTTPMKGYMGGDFSIVDCNHNVYVLNYKPIYDILKSNNATVVPNTSSDLKDYYKDVVKGHESDFTEDSLNQFYVAAYKVLKANPLEYSEATYQNNFSGTVDLAAENIESAVNEFNNINLKTRADFSDLENAVADAQDVLDNSADDYTAASIAALDAAVKAVTFLDYNAEERANMPADSYQQDIDAQANAVSAAYTALVGKIAVTYAPLSGNDVVVKFEPGASAAEVEAAAPALPGNEFTDGKHYTYSWDKDFAAVTETVTYTQERNEAAHSYTYTHITSSDPSQHTATCSVNGQSHSETVNCSFSSVHTNADGNTNGFTTYTCDDCSYQFVEYDTQDFTAYTDAYADYEATIGADDYEAHYTEASRTAYEAAVAAAVIDTTDETLSAAAIANAAADITDAKDELAVQNYTISFKHWGSSSTTSFQLPYGATAEDVAAQAPENTVTDYNETRHYTYDWETFVAVTGNKNYIEQRTSTPHSYTPVHTEADGATNGYTTYTCVCGHSYVEYDAQDWSAYDTAVAAYDAKAAEEDFETKYTEASLEVFAAAADNKFASKAQTVSQSAIDDATTALQNAVNGLEEAPNNGYSLTLEDTVEVNFYIDTEFYNAEDGYITYEFLKNNDEMSAERAEFTVQDEELATMPNGTRQLEIDVAPAQLAEKFVINVYNKDGNKMNDAPIEASIAGYCQAILESEAYSEYHAVVKALLDYGALADEYFGYAAISKEETGEDYSVPHSSGYKADVDVSEFRSKAKASVKDGVDASGKAISVTGVSYVALIDPELRFYVSQTSDIWCYYTDLSINDESLTAEWVKTENGNCVRVTGLKASDFAKTFTITIGTYEITYNGYAYLYTALSNSTDTKLKDLAKGVYRYAAACEAKFNA